LLKRISSFDREDAEQARKNTSKKPPKIESDLTQLLEIWDENETDPLNLLELICAPDLGKIFPRSLSTEKDNPFPEFQKLLPTDTDKRLWNYFQSGISGDILTTQMDYTRIPFARIFDNALLGGIIRVCQTEAFGKAMTPLEIIHQRPNHVAAHIHAIEHGKAGLDEMIFQYSIRRGSWIFPSALTSSLKATPFSVM
jgi:hypothetical protein